MTVHALWRLAGACLIAAAVTVPAGAQARDKKKHEPRAKAPEAYNRMAIPKPSKRSYGELDGWDDAAKGKQAGKAKAAKAQQAPDKKAATGIPLPTSKQLDASDYSAVGFDKNGNFSTGLKF